MNKRKQSQKTPQTQSKFGYAVLIGTAILILAGVGWVVLREPAVQEDVSQARVPVQILDPALFSGKTRAAYQAAMDMPGLLEQMPCYCGCMQYSGHNHNLDCFTDNHGVG